MALGLSLKLLSDSFDPNVLRTLCIPEISSPHALRFCSGHDYGVYVMAFMDVLSIKTDELYFDKDDVRHLRDLCLMSIVDGKIAHFPMHYKVCDCVLSDVI